MTAKRGYPFPSRTSIKESECYYLVDDIVSFEQKQNHFESKISNGVINIKLQYFSIEHELIKAFQYVNPHQSNLSTSSIKFGTIIRESANLYEQISRIVFEKLYENSDSINIFNYLSLDVFFNFKAITIYSPLLQNLSLHSTNILWPFQELNTWDQNSSIEFAQIPLWWKAYNKIKHSPNEITTYSTLENAIRATLAAFIIISKHFGPGVVSGSLFKPRENGRKIIEENLNVEQSQLFMYSEDLFGYTFRP